MPVCVVRPHGQYRSYWMIWAVGNGAPTDPSEPKRDQGEGGPSPMAPSGMTSRHTFTAIVHSARAPSCGEGGAEPSARTETVRSAGRGRALAPYSPLGRGTWAHHTAAGGGSPVGGCSLPRNQQRIDPGALDQFR